jgi:hypothetical protein
VASTEKVLLQAAAARLRARFAHLTPEVVDEALREAVARFDGRPIRTYVPILVGRAASDVLRAGPRGRPLPLINAVG